MNHYDNVKFYNDVELRKANGVEMIGNGRDHVFYNIENKSKDIIFKGYKPNKRILILRDPLNWTASILKRVNNLSFNYDNNRIKGIRCLSAYKEHYDLYKSNKYYGINYNKWFSNKSYRRQIEKDLGLKETDKGINKVMKYGRGSSFDGRTFDGKASKMKTNERWLEYKDRDEIRMILEDPFFINILDKEFDIKP